MFQRSVLSFFLVLVALVSLTTESRASCEEGLSDPRRDYIKARGDGDDLTATQALMAVLAANADTLELSTKARAGIKIYQRILVELQQARKSPAKAVALSLLRDYLWANGPFFWRWINHRLENRKLRVMASEVDLKLSALEGYVSALLGIPVDDYFRRIVSENFTEPSSLRRNVRSRQRGALLKPLAMSVILSLSGLNASQFLTDAAFASQPDPLANYPVMAFMSDAQSKAGLSIEKKKVVMVRDRRLIADSTIGDGLFNERILAKVDVRELPMMRDLKAKASEFTVIEVDSFEQAAAALNQHTDADVRILYFHGYFGDMAVNHERLSKHIDNLNLLPADKSDSAVVYVSCGFGTNSNTDSKDELWVRMARKLSPRGKAYSSNVLMLMDDLNPSNPKMGLAARNQLQQAMFNAMLTNMAEEQMRQGVIGPFDSVFSQIPETSHLSGVASAYAKAHPGMRVYDGQTGKVVFYSFESK